jgi:hypothetical protein
MSESGPVATLQRWEQFGGRWRVDARDAQAVTVLLCRCDSDEVQERIVSDDPALRAYVGERESSDV